jgi:hypothetical protein
VESVVVDTQTATNAFVALTPEQQIRFLATFGHNLTIAARSNYTFQSPEVSNPKGLRAINELQHRLFNHLRALQTPGSFRFPDDLFVASMLDHKDSDLRAACTWAFNDALKKTVGA